MPSTLTLAQGELGLIHLISEILGALKIRLRHRQLLSKITSVIEQLPDKMHYMKRGNGPHRSQVDSKLVPENIIPNIFKINSRMRRNLEKLGKEVPKLSSCWTTAEKDF